VTAICFPFPGDGRFGEGLSRALGAELAELEIHRFPDGETRVRLGSDCAGRSVIFVGGGRNPNREALPFYFAAHAARAMGATSIGLVAPYLAYMRQDTQFHHGEAVSAVAYARFLSSSLDWIATVDPHLHRIRSLDEIFTIPALCVSSMPAVAHWIDRHVIAPVIVGPDVESRQWAESVAQALGVPWTVLAKNRAGDRDVSVSLPDPAILRGRSPVIVDDIASSGHTLAAAARALRDLGSSPVTCIVVHALLNDSDQAALHASGVERLVSTNTAAHGTNAIDVIPLLADRVRVMLEGGRGASR
jgi:ribose-phosphate pyrophosphokinase